MPAPNNRRDQQRIPAEILYQKELERLRQHEQHPVPPGWRLSPIAVEKFILGDTEHGIQRKFVADRELVTRVIIALATNRGAMLVGQPGTAKSWLSELLCAAISGQSSLTVQGGAVTDLRQLLYGWNEAVMQQRGPCEEALVPGPLLLGMQRGQLVRFEELARTAPPLQDALLSILSERMVSIAELPAASGVIYARNGFNIIGTSNTRDQGVNKMSAALKRRMNFATIAPIANIDDEIDVVRSETQLLLDSSGVSVTPDADVIAMLVTIFHELRNGQSLAGRSTDRLTSTDMSTAEAVAVAHAMGVHAFYYRDGKMRAEDLVHFIIGAAVKDDQQDRRRMRHYFETEVAVKEGAQWRAVYDCIGLL